MSADEVIGLFHQAGWPVALIERMIQVLAPVNVNQVKLVVKRNGTVALRTPRWVKW